MIRHSQGPPFSMIAGSLLDSIPTVMFRERPVGFLRTRINVTAGRIAFVWCMRGWRFALMVCPWAEGSLSAELAQGPHTITVSLRKSNGRNPRNWGWRNPGSGDGNMGYQLMPRGRSAAIVSRCVQRGCERHTRKRQQPGPDAATGLPETVPPTSAEVLPLLRPSALSGSHGSA